MPYSAITAQYTLPCFIFCSVSFSRSPLEQLEAEKEERELKLKKMQQEMEQVFEMKVKEKKKKLKDSETEVRVVGWARFYPKKPEIKIKNFILLRWPISFPMQIVGRSCWSINKIHLVRSYPLFSWRLSFIHCRYEKEGER